MSKINMRSWQGKIQILVWRMTNKKNPMHRRRVASWLEELAARLREETDLTQTRLLTIHPSMPPKVFAACTRVGYEVGTKLRREMFVKLDRPPLPRQRMSAESRQKWEHVVLQEIFSK
jgi:hypothetical protein